MCFTSVAHNQTTPLHRAAYRGHTPVVQLLLRFNADPTIQGNVTSFNSLYQIQMASRHYIRPQWKGINNVLGLFVKHAQQQYTLKITKKDFQLMLPYLLRQWPT